MPLTVSIACGHPVDLVWMLDGSRNPVEQRMPFIENNKSLLKKKMNINKKI